MRALTCHSLTFHFCRIWLSFIICEGESSPEWQLVLISEEEEVALEGNGPFMGHRGQLGDWGELCRGLEGKEQGHCARGLPRSHHSSWGVEDSGYCGFMVCVDVFTGGTTPSSSFSPAPIPGICGAPPGPRPPNGWMLKGIPVGLRCVPGT